MWFSGIWFSVSGYLVVEVLTVVSGCVAVWCLCVMAFCDWLLWVVIIWFSFGRLGLVGGFGYWCDGFAVDLFVWTCCVDFPGWFLDGRLQLRVWVCWG